MIFSPLLGRTYSAKCLCAVWLILAVRLLIPFSIPFSQPILDLSSPAQSITSQFPALPAANGGQLADPAPLPAQPVGSSSPSDGSFSMGGLPALVWILGAALLLLWHLLGYFLFRRSVRRFARPVQNGNLLALYQKLLGQMHLEYGEKIPLLFLPTAKSPMMAGFFKPVILLPLSIPFEEKELELILRHELMHYKRRDPWYKLLLICANAMHWFNPIVYLMVRAANEKIENACDYEIVKNTDLETRKTYSESILSAISSDQARRIELSTYFRGGEKVMKQRFTNIFDRGIKKRGIALLTVLILLVSVSGTLVACSPKGASSGQTGSSSGQTSAGSSSSGSTAEGNVAELSGNWAEAVKNRDGKAQYALMTQSLQKSVYDSFSGLNWVTGTSSPWVESYTVQAADGGAEILFQYASSAGPVGTYRQDLTFEKEDGTLKISGISDPVPADTPTGDSADAVAPSFSDLIHLLGMTRDELESAITEAPVSVDEGGLGFEKTGIRVWFDTATYTKVAQVLIMTDTIDLNGVRLGDSLSDFEGVFGQPISDENGDAHFKYGDIYLSVVRDTKTDKVIAVYLLQENF